jgi:hypothetical protein
MDYELTDEYIAEARQRAYRFQGQWCGTSGSLAADVARLLIERKKMQGFITDLQDSNAALREAVETRLAGGCCDGGKCHAATDEAPEVWKHLTKESAEKYAAHVAEHEEAVPVDWILQGQKEMEASTDEIRWTGDSIIASPPDGLRPGSVPFMEVLEEVKRLHIAKSQDYGADNDALANIRSGADVVNLAPWKACLIRLADKMTRLRTVCHTGSCTFDGVDDTLKDICAYSAIALVLYREGQSDPV